MLLLNFFPFLHFFCALQIRSIFDANASKKATNLSINSDLLSKARNLNINLSATLERALEDELRKAERNNWLNDNKKAIDELNLLIGVQNDYVRFFHLDEGEFVLLTHQMTSVPESILKTQIASLENLRYEILAAIDMLISGISGYQRVDRWALYEYGMGRTTSGTIQRRY